MLRNSWLRLKSTYSSAYRNMSVNLPLIIIICVEWFMWIMCDWPCFVNIEHGLMMFIRDDEDVAQQDQAQAEQAPITMEDLEIIKDRETNIRQLEVGLHHTPCSSDFLWGRIRSSEPSFLYFLASIPSGRHYGCEPNLQGPGSDDPWPGRDHRWALWRIQTGRF